MIFSSLSSILYYRVYLLYICNYFKFKNLFSVQWQIRWPWLRVEPPYFGVTTGESVLSHVPNHPQLRLLEINWFGLEVPKRKVCLREKYRIALAENGVPLLNPFLDHNFSNTANMFVKPYLLGGLNPLKNMKVSWDHYSQLNGKVKFMSQTTNHNKKALLNLLRLHEKPQSKPDQAHSPGTPSRY